MTALSRFAVHVVHVARLVGMLIRPPVLAILLLFAAIGIAAVEPQTDLHPLLTTVVVIVGGWLINAAALNDLADEPIDRVNLQTARGRPLVSGQASRAQMLVIGLVSGGLALAVAGWQHPRVAAVVAAGLVLNVAYSFRPVRLSARGALASLLLPAAYVVLPYLVGALTVRPDIGRLDLLLLSGLYVGFIGRILLKDFRDAAGDALFGKWTFLLRHGRTTTCRVSAVCWALGTALVLMSLPANPAVVVVGGGYLVCALHGLVRLAGEEDVLADQVIIAALAQAGRGLCVTVLADLTMRGEGWATIPQLLVTALLGVFFLGQYVITAAEREPAWALRPC